MPPTPPTPSQVKAARALLAWSQQDLARNAGVAVSTVADFERGSRTPIPNNAESIRATLQNAGITFPPGGAVVGPPLPALAAISKSGAPIRFVDATDIFHWADRRDGQGSLPRLLSTLVRATGLITLHFPSDEGVQLSGWDGTSHATSQSEYVPAGATGWEISTQHDGIRGKADDDYEKRTKDPLGLNPAESTFIFVTPRQWSQKDEWVAQKKSVGTWRDVRAYDGTDLVHWIETYPAVGQWLATYLRKRPTGAHQLEEIWNEWSRATEWPITAELILAGRDEQATILLRWLRSPAATYALQGESAEEVVSFLHAAISQLPSDVAGHYLARCLVATTADSARVLGDSVTPLILVLLDPEPGLAESIVQKGHHVLLAYGGNPNHTELPRLERPFPEDLETALKNGGVAEDKARSLARESSRSLAILRRLMSTQPGRLPAWAQNAPPRELLAALLAGGWDEGSASDTAVVSRLADMPYEKVVAAITPFAGSLDRPLHKVGSVWKITSPQDAWMLLSQYLTTADINRFESVITDVLGTSDPRYVLDPSDRWYASLKGVQPEYSTYLRHGLGEILILLALYGNRAATVPDASLRPNRIVRKLLEQADGERWWSLSRDFQLLAEASPDSFLDAVDASLLQQPPPIAALFGSDGDPLFGGEHLSDLLWALESLAWSTDYLSRVSLVLAGLDAIDPGGRQGNRPKNSLRPIFVLWLPQTSASFEQRFRVIDVLRRRYPKQAWRLLLGIMPTGHDAFSPSAKPRWRDFPSAVTESITWGQAGEAISRRLLEDVGGDEKRWGDVLDRLTAFPDRAAVIAQLSRVAPNLGDARPALWVKLRRVLNHHRIVPDAKWALPEADLGALEAIYDSIAPIDPIERIAWMFNSAVALPSPQTGRENNGLELATQRQAAATSTLTDLGVDAIFRLANAVDDARYLGDALVKGGIDQTLRDNMIELSLKSDSPLVHTLAFGLILSTFFSEKQSWVEDLFNRALSDGWGERAMLTILRAMPSNRWVWSLAHKGGAAVELAYWREVPAYVHEPQEGDWAIAAERLIAVGRAAKAAEMVGTEVVKADVSSDLLVKILSAAARQPLQTQGEARSDPTMFQYYVGNIFKRLDEASDVTMETLATLEWTYLPLLEHSERKPKVILQSLARMPQLFVELICALYKPTEESGVVEEPPENVEHAQDIATQAYNVLRLWDIVPGTMPNGKIDSLALAAWIAEARKMANARGRGPIADQKIGEILSAAPVEMEDGVWPARAVRETIERAQNGDVDIGVLVGRRNRRGVTGRLPRDGGKLERMESKNYRDAAKATALEWPRTSALLKKMADEYDQDARWHDQLVERLDW
jgi:transcriptional regulator with XRE-family HTH domain